LFVAVICLTDWSATADKTNLLGWMLDPENDGSLQH
jgi:hypothetical protein